MMTKKHSDQSIEILYQSDNNYAVVTAVSIVSLLENNTKIKEITIHLVDGGITKDNLDKIKKIVQNYHRKLNIISGNEIEKKLISYNCRPYKGSYVTYYKLLAYGMIKTESDRILMLDGDILVQKSLEELFVMDQKKFIMSEVIDPYMPDYLKKSIGIPDTRPYFSAGVMLINLHEWKTQRCEEKIISHWKNVKSDYLFADQDITNILFGDKIQELHLKYNYYSKNIMLKPYERVLMNISKSMLEDVNKSGPVLVHCIDESWRKRPWFKGNTHTMNTEWNYYLDKTPWAKWEKLNASVNIYHRVDKIMFAALPRFLYAHLLHFISEIFARLSISKRMLDSKKMNVTD